MDRNQNGWGRQIQIPDVVADFLKMPQAFSACRIQCNDTIAEKIVSPMAVSNEVGFGRSGCQVKNTPRTVQCGTTPIVGSSFHLTPGFMAIFTSPRPCMKPPSLLTRLKVEGKGVAFVAAQQDECVVDGRCHSKMAGPSASLLAKRSDGFSILWVQHIEPLASIE